MRHFDETADIIRLMNQDLIRSPLILAKNHLPRQMHQKKLCQYQTSKESNDKQEEERLEHPVSFVHAATNVAQDSVTFPTVVSELRPLLARSRLWLAPRHPRCHPSH